MLGWGVDRHAGTMQLLEELPAALLRSGAQGRGKRRPNVEPASQDSQSEHWAKARTSSSVTLLK